MYLAAERAVYDLVLQAGGFDPQTCRIDDWRVLDASGKVYAVIEQAGNTLEADRINGAGAQGVRTQQHEVAVVLLTPIREAEGGDDRAVQASKQTAEDLADFLAQYEKLGGAALVWRAQVVRITPPEAVRRAQTATGAATHIQQRLVVRVITRQAWDPIESV